MTIGGAAIDDNDQVWVATDRGLYRLASATDVAAEPSFNDTFGAWTSPNPFFDVVNVRVRNLGRTPELVAMMKIVDVFGNVIADLTTDLLGARTPDMTIELALPKTPPGAYFLIYGVGNAVRVWPMVKL